MSQRDRPASNDPGDEHEDPADAILAAALRRYKAVVFPLEHPSPVDQQIIERLMGRTESLRKSVSTRKDRVSVFRYRMVLAVAASLTLLLGSAVLFRAWRDTPDLLVVSTITTDSWAFAMRGGETGPVLNDRLVDVLKDYSSRRLGESRVTVRRIQKDPVEGSALSLPRLWASLGKVGQDYVILTATGEDESGECYLFYLVDARARKVITTRTLRAGASAKDMTEVLADLLKRVR